MKKSRPLHLVLAGAVLVAMLTLMTVVQHEVVFAQDNNNPSAETVTPQPGETPATPVPTDPPATATFAPPTNTPLPGVTDAPTNTPTAPETVEPGPTATLAPPAAPVAIPEPITVVLFGTGLAALSAAAASRRKNNGKGDSE